MPVDVVSPVLVGRARELERLRAAVARTTAGEPSVVLVGGEAGVGKSRLLEAAFGRSPDDVRVLTGGLHRAGRRGPAARPARRGPAHAGPDDARRRAGPDPRPGPPGAGPPAAGAGRRRRRSRPPTTGSTAQLFELVLGVFGRLGAERPLVLIVEDLHWADRTTLDLVAFLVRALSGTRVLLVLTYRSDEVDRRSPVRPAALGLGAAARRRTPPAGAVQPDRGRRPDRRHPGDVTRRGHGRPDLRPVRGQRLLRRGARAHRARRRRRAYDLPPSLRDVLLARAEQLSRPAQRLLRTAAVAGRRVPSGCWPRSRRCSAGELYEALREAVDASLLLVDGTDRGYAFRHALTRDAVYADLLPGERVELHTAYAEALDRDPGLAGDDASVEATLAVHWYAAHDMPRALAASVQAGRQAMAAFAPAEARQHLERALEVWRSVPDAETRAGADQIEVLQLTARATFYVGDPERALTLLRQALDLIDADRRPRARRLRGRAAVHDQARPRRRLGQHRGTRASARPAARGPAQRGSSAVLGALANMLMRHGRRRPPRSRGRRSRRPARSARRCRRPTR